MTLLQASVRRLLIVSTHLTDSAEWRGTCFAPATKGAPKQFAILMLFAMQTFDELLAGIGTDGSRAHTLTDACTIQ